MYNIVIKYGIASFSIFKKMEKEKMANQKLENLRNLGNIIPSVQFWPIAETKNSDLKNLGKNFGDFWDIRVFRVYDLARRIMYK